MSLKSLNDSMAGCPLSRVMSSMRSGKYLMSATQRRYYSKPGGAGPSRVQNANFKQGQKPHTGRAERNPARQRSTSLLPSSPLAHHSFISCVTLHYDKRKAIWVVSVVFNRTMTPRKETSGLWLLANLATDDVSCQ